MITRYLSSAAAGLAITTSLLWAMHYLIEAAEPVETSHAPRHFLDWVHVRKDRPVQPIDTSPQPIPSPTELPNHNAPVDPAGATTPIGVRASATTPAGPVISTAGFGYADSVVINIINAQQDYPVKASEMGLEGHVIVIFDITDLGTVENVSVLESSHKIFNRAAVKAAYRSRYKPKTVDGIPQATKGLRKLFRFEMEI